MWHAAAASKACALTLTQKHALLCGPVAKELTASAFPLLAPRKQLSRLLGARLASTPTVLAALLPLRHTGGALTTTGGHAHVHASAAAQLPSRLSAGQGAAGVLVATQLARLSATHTAPLSAALAAPHALRAVRLASNAAGGGRQNRSGGSEDAAVTAAEDPFSSLTDKIPAKPVTRTETVSYGVVILAGLGVALAAAWAVLKELVFEPKEYTVFGLALDRCRTHSVVAVRLGSPLTGYGVESHNRSARQRIRHKIGVDAQGRQTVTVQFQLRGPRGVATVLAEATQDRDASGGWRLNYVQVGDPQGHMAPIQVITTFEQHGALQDAASGGRGVAAGRA